MKYEHDDGGRVAAGFKGVAGDCTTRAIAIATGRDYRVVYRTLTEMTKEMTGGLSTSVRSGCPIAVSYKYLTDSGWELHLTPKRYLIDAPTDRMIIASMHRHMAAVDHGTVRDSWDSRRDNRTKNGSPRLLGYYIKY